ncbi:hypothetical protein DERP_011202 [Dermatophagoides pteronyssinus]|uniref:Uncharacterized protein n=1 Tax=Dermatophagoides pteronyssinus TaxID=6956 RepID=A0ABQ8JCX1_DERPT|nr:hypothetical protein DERP_011202 [Dermatophagoides pteronyssinus]
MRLNNVIKVKRNNLFDITHGDCDVGGPKIDIIPSSNLSSSFKSIDCIDSVSFGNAPPSPPFSSLVTFKFNVIDSGPFFLHCSGISDGIVTDKLNILFTVSMKLSD